MDSNNTIFYNADYIVIEYLDIIKSPYLMLLNVIRKNEKLKEILKIERIENLDDASLYEWYLTRKHQNFLIDLNRYPDEISNEKLDEILDDQMKLTDRFYTDAQPLILTDTMKVLQNKKLVKDIIIYYPHETPYMKEDLQNFMKCNYTVLHDFNEVLKNAGCNSTYFLSDIDKLEVMKEKKCLTYSTVILPIEYRYNKKNMTDFRLDFKELYKTNPFKLAFFNSCTHNVYKEDSGSEVKEDGI